jgi:hypothetical protein
MAPTPLPTGGAAVPEAHSEPVARIGGGPAPAPVRLDPGATPLFGAATAGKGPLKLSGTAGGPVDLSKAHRNCQGTAQVAPNHVVTVAAGLVQLVVKDPTGSAPPSTLFVRLPDGRIACATHSTTSTISLETSSAPGPVAIWLGSYSTKDPAAYELSLVTKPAKGKPRLATKSSDLVPDGTDFVANKPVMLHGMAFHTEAVMYWTPGGGPRLQVDAGARGPLVSIATRPDGGAWQYPIDVPAGLEADSIVEATLTGDGKLLVRAQREPSGSGDPGQTRLWLLAYDRGSKTVTVASTFSGTAGDAAPSWGR